MRNFSPRPALSVENADRLKDKRDRIAASANPKETADTIYTNSRQTQWFEQSVIQALKGLAGAGERCMFCGGSEASQVDHFKPKANYPLIAMDWENFIWICGFCNQNKGNEFPLDATGGHLLINPLDENIWEFFRLDKFGYLLPKWDIALDDFNPRAGETEGQIKINRQAAQEARQARFLQLEQYCRDWLAMHATNLISAVDLATRLSTELSFPLHQEVPQYFLKGEGNTEEPFASVCAIMRAAGLFI